MYELMLDTADEKVLSRELAAWPVAGVTTNPSILKKEGQIDVYARLDAIRKLCGPERSLHVQVVSGDTAGILAEAGIIRERLGQETCIKIPVSEAGLPAIKTLAQQGVHVTATAVYTTLQGMMAVLAGAEYVAVYVNRMENNCIDPGVVIGELRRFIDGCGSPAKILGASFKNVGQVTQAFAAGAQSVTVAPEVLHAGLGMASIGAAVEGFRRDFETLHGTGSTMGTI